MTSITRTLKGVKRLIFALLAIVLMVNVILAQNPGKRLRERLGGGGGNEMKQQRLEMRQERLGIKQERLRQRVGKNLNPGFGGGMQARVWARALKLTDEQIIRMRQVMRVSAENYLLTQKQVQEKRFQLEQATFSETLNEEVLKQIAIDLGKLEGQQILLRTKVQVQIRNILTSEQLKLYNELRFGLNPSGDFLEKENDAPAEQKNNNQ
ncbi:MAG: hypothetical protein FD167_2922 [bacterium]|nr:MAG: hypothetical protein FD167_2922 [bacterium]